MQRKEGTPQMKVGRRHAFLVLGVGLPLTFIGCTRGNEQSTPALPLRTDGTPVTPREQILQSASPEQRAVFFDHEEDARKLMDEWIKPNARIPLLIQPEIVPNNENYDKWVLEKDIFSRQQQTEIKARIRMEYPAHGADPVAAGIYGGLGDEIALVRYEILGTSDTSGRGIDSIDDWVVTEEAAKRFFVFPGNTRWHNDYETNSRGENIPRVNAIARVNDIDTLQFSATKQGPFSFRIRPNQ